MDQLDSAQNHAGAGDGFEAEDGAQTAFDGAMILLDPIVEVSTLPDPDRLEPASRTVLKTALGITRQDGFPVGLAAVDDDPFGSAVPVQRRAQKPFGSNEVPSFAEPELDRIAMVVDGPVEIRPTPAHLDVDTV